MKYTSGSNVIQVDVEKEMKTSFMDYSMSVIVSRALPDVRDGSSGAPPDPLHHVRKRPDP